MDNLDVQVSATRCMPSVVVVPSPKCREHEHSYAPGQEAPIENIVFATLTPNPFLDAQSA
jgi:hypothetical protein